LAHERPSGLLLLDKPPGFSSTQALARAKRLLGARKAGHTGTLDPFATGLLPLVFGEATKFSRFLIDADKAYLATLRLGMESSTGDTEGEIVARHEVRVDERQVEAALARFRGSQQQTPPMHSAVRIDGRRLYEHAREGREIARAARDIEVTHLAAVGREGDELRIAVTCSKGTYVRTLAADIGRALGCGAYLTALRRTAVAGFGLGDAVTLERLEAAGVEAARGFLRPLEVLVEGLPRWDSPEEEAGRFAHGQEIACEAAAPGAEIALFAPGGRFVGVGRCEAPGRLAPLRLLAGAGAEIP
jgi:tRNA pseudouridine55 synthase